MNLIELTLSAPSVPRPATDVLSCSNLYTTLKRAGLAGHSQMPVMLVGVIAICRQFVTMESGSMLITATIKKKQGCRNNDDQAARRPHILCSICAHSFGSLAKHVRLFGVLLHNRRSTVS